MYLGLGWWCSKAEFSVRSLCGKRQYRGVLVIRSMTKVTIPKKLQYNTCVSNISLTAGWSFQCGWPEAGSWCPGGKGWTHPRRSTGSQKQPGSEAGTVFGPRDRRDTSSDIWRKDSQGETHFHTYLINFISGALLQQFNMFLKDLRQITLVNSHHAWQRTQKKPKVTALITLKKNNTTLVYKRCWKTFSERGSEIPRFIRHQQKSDASCEEGGWHGNSDKLSTSSEEVAATTPKRRLIAQITKKMW